MFFKNKENKVSLRQELMDYYCTKYREECDKLQNDFTERLVDDLRSNTVLNESFVKQNEADAEKLLHIVTENIERISSMSDDDVQKHHYEIFGR